MTGLMVTCIKMGIRLKHSSINVHERIWRQQATFYCQCCKALYGENVDYGQVSAHFTVSNKNVTKLL